MNDGAEHDGSRHDGAEHDGAVVEAAALAVGLGSALRRAGVPVSPDRAVKLAAALRLVPPSGREPLYWAARVTMVSSREQLAMFDAVFAAVFDGHLDPADSRGEANNPPSVGSEMRTRAAPADQRRSQVASPQSGPQPPLATPGNATGTPPAGDRETILAMASDQEHLHTTAFAQLTMEEQFQVQALVRHITLATPERRSRRTRKTSHGGATLDIRRTIRAARRSGADAGILVHAKRRMQPRRLIFLCDVSASMEPYTRIFLSLLQGAVSRASAEAFVFSTRLTRLTRQLAVHDSDAALALAAAATPDWAGGTRLAQSLREFLDRYGRRGMARGAVVVVLSDGWAQDAPELVTTQMARLRRLAYRIVWVNPRKAGPEYQPLVGGMAAALPFCDAFVSGHSYQALAEVAAAIRANNEAAAHRYYSGKITMRAEQPQRARRALQPAVSGRPPEHLPFRSAQPPA